MRGDEVSTGVRPRAARARRHLECSGGRSRAYLVVDADGDHDRALVTVVGELDAATAPRLRERLSEATGDGRRGDLVVDLGWAEFVGLAGLQVLAEAATAMRADGARLVLRRPSALTRRVLDVTRLEELFVVERPA